MSLAFPKILSFIIPFPPFVGLFFYYGLTWWIALGLAFLIAWINASQPSGWSSLWGAIITSTFCSGITLLFMRQWEPGLIAITGTVSAVTLSITFNSLRRKRELRKIAARVSYSSTGKRCMKCGQEAPAYSSRGNKCPHCGVIWGHEIGGSSW